MLFRLHAAVSARRIDETDNGAAELFCLAHQAQRLAIAFGGWHTEIAGNVLLGSLALLLANDSDRAAIQIANPTHNCAVIHHMAVAVEFHKVRKNLVDII